MAIGAATSSNMVWLGGQGGATVRYTGENGVIVDNTTDKISADFDTVQHKLTAGDNITISNNVISATGGGSRLPAIFSYKHSYLAVKDDESGIEWKWLFNPIGREGSVTIENGALHFRFTERIWLQWPYPWFVTAKHFKFRISASVTTTPKVLYIEPALEVYYDSGIPLDPHVGYSYETGGLMPVMTSGFIRKCIDLNAWFTDTTLNFYNYFSGIRVRVLDESGNQVNFDSFVDQYTFKDILAIR